MQQHDPQDKKLILETKLLPRNVTVVKNRGFWSNPKQKDPHFTGIVCIAADFKREEAPVVITNLKQNLPRMYLKNNQVLIWEM